MEDETGWTKPVRQTPRRLGAQPKPQLVEHPRLTRRQQKILGLLSNGYSNEEIANRLGIAVETVKSHVKHLFVRLGARNRPHAVTRGFQLGLLSIDSAEHSFAPSRESPYE